MMPLKVSETLSYRSEPGALVVGSSTLNNNMLPR